MYKDAREFESFRENQKESNGVQKFSIQKKTPPPPHSMQKQIIFVAPK